MSLEGFANEHEVDYLCGLLELMLDDPERAGKVAGLVSREAFAGDCSAMVYQAIAATLTAHGSPTIGDLSARAGWGEIRESVIALLEMGVANRCAYSLGVDRHAWNVRRAWKNRIVEQAAGMLDATIKNPDATPLEKAAAAKAVEDAAREVESDTRTPTLMDAVDEWLRMESRPVVPTGFWPLDSITGGGMAEGGLFVLAAPPSVGKSALALQLVLGALDHDRGLKAVWCLGEMTMDAIARRAACHWSTRGGMHRVSMSAAENVTDLARGAGLNLCMTIGDRLKIVKPPLSMQRIEQAVAEAGAKVVVIDYVQLVQMEGAADRRAEVDGIVKRLRSMSLELGVATICVSNVAKVVSGDTRIGAIGKESSELDFAADLFLLGVPESDADQNGLRAVRWACKKNRHGRCQDIETTFDGGLQTFTAAEAAPEAAFGDWEG
jgi:replicative DNA helicase